MKKMLATTLIITCILTGCTKTNEKKKVIKIGISQIVEYVALDQSREGFIKALEDNGYKEGDNIDIDYQNAQGDITTTQTIGKKFASGKKDLIYAIATPSAQGSYNATKKIPIIITAVTDPVQAGIIKSLDKPETNVSGTSDYLPVKKQLELIKELMPNAKRIGILYNTSEVNSQVQVNELKKAAKGYEIVTSGVTSTNEVNSAISSLLTKIDVLYVPTDQLIVSSMPIIVKNTLEAKIPVIASEKGSVESGALATVGIDYYKLGYEAGNMAVDVLKGNDISNMPIKISEETEVYINKDTLKSLNISMPEIKNVKYIDNK
ncbi:ABC transporter substrate-binding protein [Clostridium sp. CM028]|uniref:ABC transporter substrate-binding protein n=1 Tax=unclassified Clostridium TaxID=2614128 RepID=UPI001C6E2342|nr:MULTISPECIES: ABC transporter substrate-binding protein [unclassified Clostridium]MBW9145065.1 ABC transporter substrate-binding protein [Clostridium sp. CM027]MBW9148305.1 ABC transporter substrate-binding protein [Clostridium sp. CM028]UVE40203.1 ABC transporter substrate-binding protein [Clostridium sp. CM027]WLC60882.1 ABC transporter substrate-binding protein [Clostridium sp. CM028]